MMDTRSANTNCARRQGNMNIYKQTAVRVTRHKTRRHARQCVTVGQSRRGENCRTNTHASSCRAKYSRIHNLKGKTEHTDRKKCSRWSLVCLASEQGEYNRRSRYPTKKRSMYDAGAYSDKDIDEDIYDEGEFQRR